MTRPVNGHSNSLRNMASAKSRGHNRKAEMGLEAISTRRTRETDLCDQSKLLSSQVWPHWSSQLDLESKRPPRKSLNIRLLCLKAVTKKIGCQNDSKMILQ